MSGPVRGTRLARLTLVVVSMSAGVRKTRQVGRGFSLLELLVVVLIIGILSALAIPSMSTSKFDRATYNDAGAIMQLFREARTRALSRGAAQLISMTSNGLTDRGTFQLWESITGSPMGNGNARLPVPYCTTPTVWLPLVTGRDAGLGPGASGIVLVDGVNLNTQAAGGSSIEVAADIETAMQVYANPANSAATPFSNGFICYTPLGRSYVNVGAAAQPIFDGVLSTVGVVEIQVTRGVTANSGVAGGSIRSVLLPPSGMARIFSHT